MTKATTMKMMIRYTLLLSLLCLSIVPHISAQDEDEEPTVVPYVTSAGTVEQFNIPIPQGWQNVGSPDLPHLVNESSTGNIYVVALEANDHTAGLQAAIQQIVPTLPAEARTSGELNIDGNLWQQRTYDLVDGQTLSAFSLLRDGVVYALIYVNPKTNPALYMIATRPETPGVEAGIQAALEALFGEAGAEAHTTEEITLANGDWTLQRYENLTDESVEALAQLRGNTTFAAVQAGEGDTLETINSAFFDVLFGFFVTPDTVSYLLLALGVIALVLITLIASLVIRFRNLRKDAALIRDLQAGLQ
jgi:hypothetical protein